MRPPIASNCALIQSRAGTIPCVVLADVEQELRVPKATNVWMDRETLAEETLATIDPMSLSTRPVPASDDEPPLDDAPPDASPEEAGLPDDRLFPEDALPPEGIALLAELPDEPAPPEPVEDGAPVVSDADSLPAAADNAPPFANERESHANPANASVTTPVRCPLCAIARASTSTDYARGALDACLQRTGGARLSS